MTLSEAAVADLPAVEAELTYLKAMATRPRNYTYDPTNGEPASNAIYETHRVAIHNARPIAAGITLDAEGFAVVAHRSAVSDFYDEDEIRRVYYPEAEALLKKVTGASRVFVFDHTLRRHVPGAEDRRGGLRQPARRVHVDHTEKSGPQRVRDLLPEDAELLLRGRVQIINIWRPLHGPLYDAPLAVCDGRTVGRRDLVASDLIYRDRSGETYSVTYSPTHRWFYLPAMRPDEALLLKCYDSKVDGRVRFAPHTAFDDPTAPAGARPRESIELRTFVFHDA
jgi:hypothetical protein